ncbi:hypothetical protein ABZ508_32165 [Streptomyces lavendulocolor]|uniref:Alkylmercury lyase helix-turn-helix domain-containing protein n=1 Tax=Streptomyces lavendulocolor TaxID=67316 RepID=A0ABV2WF93_9ACTN|nr:hypothetical protein GCM10018771_19680 [Streptomyces cellulosae]
MDTDTRTLAARFTDTVNRAPGVKLWLLRPLLTLLATGEPVTLDQLAAQARATARRATASQPRIRPRPGPDSAPCLTHHRLIAPRKRSTGPLHTS